MEINRDEKWLRKLKDSLGNWQEPAPADFWSNLEKDIPQESGGVAGDSGAGVAGDAGRRRPAKYFYWAAAAAIVVVAAFLFVPQPREVLVPAPGAKMAENVPVPMSGSDMSIKMAENVPERVAEGILGTKISKNEPEYMVRQTLGTKIAQNVPEQAAGQPQQPGQIQTQQQQQQSQQQKSQQPQQPQQKSQQQQLRDAVKEALYLAEEEPARRRWMAFSAGNGAFSASPGFLKGRDMSLQDGHLNEYVGDTWGAAPSGPGGSADMSGSSNILDLQQGQVLGITNLGALDNSSVNMVGTYNNFYSFKAKEVYRELKYNHSKPVRLGVSFGYEVTRNLFLESGVSYEYLGSTMKWKDQTIHQHLHYVGVPLKANLYFSKGSNFSVYAGAGFLLERCVYGTVAGKRLSLNHWQKSVSGSIGAQLFLGGRSFLYFEPGVSRYLGVGEDVISMQHGFVIKTLHSEEPFGVTISGGVRILF